MPRRDKTTDTQRYETLKRTVAAVGLLRRGSLVRRFMPCGKPNRRCQATPPQLHGPYYQWTRTPAQSEYHNRPRNRSAKKARSGLKMGPATPSKADSDPTDSAEEPTFF